MKTLGTIKEWLKHNPDAYLTNKNFLQKGVSIFNIQKLKKSQKFTYPISFRPDYCDTENMHADPMIYFGSSCPYIVKGFFNYTAGVVHWSSGSGSTFPLSKNMIKDSNWYEYDSTNYEKGE